MVDVSGNNAAPLPEDKELLRLEGTVERVIFTNRENGYTVCELASDEGELITVVGILPFTGEGERLRVMGKYEVHGTYGKQFKAEYYEKVIPTEKSAILRYLSSGAVKGIGPKTAARIVETFAEDTFEILEKNPEYLTNIPGISPKKAEAIGSLFRQQFGMRSVMLFTGDFFGPSAAVKIYKRFGHAAVDILKQDPFLLCREVRGIGFNKVDKFAESLGLQKDAPCRIKAGLRAFLLANATGNGHVYIPLRQLLPAAADFLQLDGEGQERLAPVKDALRALLEDGTLRKRQVKGSACIFLREYDEAELTVCERLKMLDRTVTVYDPADIERLIETEERISGIRYALMQKNAIKGALRSGVMILTGGPGTGKTTVIRAIIHILEQIGCEIVLTAPTGRAAKRMSEATSREAKTIHRLLEVDFSDGETGDEQMKFRKNENEPLEQNAVIVDECSMVDTLLMASLLRAMRPGTRLILIGDADQLPSVGAGNVLSDILRSERFTTVCLKEIFRQARESLIVTGAHEINSGEMPRLTSKDGDFFFLPRDTDEKIAATIASLLAVRLPKSYGESIREQTQVISPSKKGAAGTAALNPLLQSVLNPPDKGKKEKSAGGRIFREGDKVMQIRNDYDIEWESDGGLLTAFELSGKKEDGKRTVTGRGIFNGDIGYIKEIDFKNEKVSVLFEDKLAAYDFTALDELDHAYAVTVHKSQGSEYPVVILPMFLYTPRLLTRELLYTAVTRAQKMVILVGKEEAIRLMVGNSRRPRRYTSLAELLSDFSAD